MVHKNRFYVALSLFLKQVFLLMCDGHWSLAKRGSAMGHRGLEKIQYFTKNWKGATKIRNFSSQKLNLSNEPHHERIHGIPPLTFVQNRKKLELQCFKSSRQIYINHFFFTIPKFQNRLALNWLNQISNKNYLTHYIVCRMSNNFCLKFGSANLEPACSENLTENLYDYSWNTVCT